MPDEDRSAMSKDLEMGLAQMEQIKGQLESVRNQITSLRSILMDYNNSLDVISEIEGKSKKEVLMPIGGAAFVRVNLLDQDRCVVDRGAGIFMDTDLSEAVELIKDRIESLRNGIDQMETTQRTLNENYQEISNKTQELYQKQMSSGEGPENSF